MDLPRFCFEEFYILHSLYHHLKSVGWMHQRTINAVLRKAILQTCPIKGDEEVENIIRAIIRSCIDFDINLSTGAVRFQLRNDFLDAEHFATALRLCGRPLVERAGTCSRQDSNTITTSSSTDGDETDKVPTKKEILTGKCVGGEFIDDLTKFLASIRKIGMDMIFPPRVHDKVLACVLLAFDRKQFLAHRELIDVVMDINSAGLLAQPESVTKTKIRGVLALLKHADVLMTQSPDGTPVKLKKSEAVSSFRILRKIHDDFLRDHVSKYGGSLAAEFVCLPA